MSMIAACYSSSHFGTAEHLASRLMSQQQHRGIQELVALPAQDLEIHWSGRLYNYAFLHRQLQNESAFDLGANRDDASLILQLYLEQGSSVFQRIDGVFALVIRHNSQLIAVRDRLGQMPLYLGRLPDTIVFASEFNAFNGLTDDYQAFPINTIMKIALDTMAVTDQQPIHPAYRWPDRMFDDVESIKQKLQETLMDSVSKRLTHDRQGIYLSGGLDSSIIAAITGRLKSDAQTFAVGFAKSQDLFHARLLAEQLGTHHHEYTYDLKEMLQILPNVIKQLGSFDAALVRSSVPNYLVARLASSTVGHVFSGEGADELFGGYAYMQQLSADALNQELLDILTTLGNTGLQRGDRMSMAFGITPDVPLLDQQVIQLALQIPAKYKIGPGGNEKWILREAFADWLPESIIRRKKQKFSAGAGSQLILKDYAEHQISDQDFAKEAKTAGGHPISNKEELLYYRIFHDLYPEPAAEKTVAFSRSL